jgi:3-dehydroquinate synthase
MTVMTRAAEKNVIAEAGLTEKLTEALTALELPIQFKDDKENILEKIRNDKKRRKNEITLVIPEKIGCCVLKTMQVQDALEFIKSGME